MNQMTRTLQGILFVGGLLISWKTMGCAAMPENAIKQEAPPGVDALRGNLCRGPEAPGCGTCCEQTTPDQCTLRAWTGGSESAVIPWYNSTSLEQGDCPAGCRPCATCLTRYERDLAELGPRPDCQCEHQAIGVDPCFSPRSCACYCGRAGRILQACPHLAHGPGRR